MIIVCSECFDRRACERFTEVIPRSFCADCGRLCLGYAIDVDADGSAIIPANALEAGKTLRITATGRIEKK